MMQHKVDQLCIELPTNNDILAQWRAASFRRQAKRGHVRERRSVVAELRAVPMVPVRGTASTRTLAVTSAVTVVRWTTVPSSTGPSRGGQEAEGACSLGVPHADRYTFVMKTIQVRNVPDDVHRALRTRAAAAGISLSDFALGELERAAQRPPVAELLQRARSRAGGASSRAIVAAIRAGRDRT